MRLMAQRKAKHENQDGNGSIESQRRSADPSVVLPLALLFSCQSKIAHELRTKGFLTIEQEYELQNLTFNRQEDSGSVVLNRYDAKMRSDRSPDELILGPDNIEGCMDLFN